jgi:hypothetical protein
MSLGFQGRVGTIQVSAEAVQETPLQPFRFLLWSDWPVGFTWPVYTSPILQPHHKLDKELQLPLTAKIVWSIATNSLVSPHAGRHSTCFAQDPPPRRFGEYPTGSLENESECLAMGRKNAFTASHKLETE